MKDGEDGSSATVDIVTSWNSTLSDEKVPSEKLSKNTLDGKAPTSHASSSSTYGLGTTSNYGHVKTINGLTQSSHSDGTALSAYQGKVLKDAIDAKPSASDIPTKTSDLTNDGDGTNVFVKNNDSRLSDSRTPTSHTHGNITNDGTIGNQPEKPLITGDNGVIEAGSFGTTAGTFCEGNDSRLSDARTPTAHTHTVSNITDFPTIPSKISDLTNDSDFIETSSTAGLIKNDGTIDTNSYLTTGSASSTYQEKLVSGTNIKTINNESLLGSGDINIQGGDSQNVFYGTSNSLATSQIKQITVSDWTWESGNILLVKFSNINTYSASSTTPLALNISGTYKAVKANDSFTDTNNLWVANEVVCFVYDGTNFLMIDQGIASTSYYGVTKLSSSTSSTSTSLAATASAVKAAYDLADGKADVSDIPTKISDLTNDSDFIEKSSTSGLIKNDGTVMTSGTGSTNYSAGNHTHSGYVSGTKVTSWSSTVSDSNIPSEKLVSDTFDAIEDLIGDAIQYINQ